MPTQQSKAALGRGAIGPFVKELQTAAGVAAPAVIAAAGQQQLLHFALESPRRCLFIALLPMAQAGGMQIHIAGAFVLDLQARRGVAGFPEFVQPYQLSCHRARFCGITARLDTCRTFRNGIPHQLFAQQDSGCFSPDARTLFF